MLDKITISIDEIIEESKLKHPSYIYLHGECLVFAKKLKEKLGEGEIKYLPLFNHFVLKVNGKIYDIRGNVTNIYKNENIKSLKDVPSSIISKYKS